jgi:osmotically-inducible protein OsmY
MRSRFLLVLLVAGALLAATVALRGEEPSPDWTITLKVKLALLTRFGSDALRVEVITSDGKVQLAGTVEKRETRELADEVAGKVEGVRKVENDLHLKASGESGLGRAEHEAEAEVGDAVLESKVSLALIDKFGSDGFKVGVEAASGVVTLAFPAAIGAERRHEMTGLVEDVRGVQRVIPLDKK